MIKKNYALINGDYLGQKLTFPEGDLLDGSRPSVSFNVFSTLNGVRCNLWDEVVSIEVKRLEQLSRWDNGGGLSLVSENTHDELKVWKCTYVQRKNDEEDWLNSR